MNQTETITNNILFQFSDLHRLLQERFLEELANIGLRPPQVYALAVLKDQKLSMPSEIANVLQISRPSVTTLLDRMQRDGLIQRVADKGNRRRKWIVATEKGVSLMVSATEALEKVEREIFHDQDDLLKLKKALSDVKKQILKV